MTFLDPLEQSLRGCEHVVVSRAVSPEVRRVVARMAQVREAPVYRGRTVWPAAHDPMVVETPNYWGRLEPLPRPTVRAIVIDRRTGEVTDPADVRPIPPRWDERTAALRHCLRSAAQLRGVAPAHGDPEAPWAILLLPIAAERVAASEVPGLAALAPRVPELPGGLRIEAPAGAGSEWSSVVVASIRTAMEDDGAQ